MLLRASRAIRCATANEDAARPRRRALEAAATDSAPRGTLETDSAPRGTMETVALEDGDYRESTFRRAIGRAGRERTSRRPARRHSRWRRRSPPLSVVPFRGRFALESALCRARRSVATVDVASSHTSALIISANPSAARTRIGPRSGLEQSAGAPRCVTTTRPLSVSSTTIARVSSMHDRHARSYPCSIIPVARAIARRSRAASSSETCGPSTVSVSRARRHTRRGISDGQHDADVPRRAHSIKSSRLSASASVF